VKVNISCNDDKNVMNYIMGSYALMTMDTTLEANIYMIDGICAHTLRKLVIEGCGNLKPKVITKSKNTQH
jgi:hypothetical protein